MDNAPGLAGTRIRKTTHTTSNFVIYLNCIPARPPGLWARARYQELSHVIWWQWSSFYVKLTVSSRIVMTQPTRMFGLHILSSYSCSYSQFNAGYMELPLMVVFYITVKYYSKCPYACLFPAFFDFLLNKRLYSLGDTRYGSDIFLVAAIYFALLRLLVRNKLRLRALPPLLS